MADSRVTIHECPFHDRVCENYVCRQSIGKKKYFIGNPHAHGQKHLLCEDCIRHMVGNLPPEFVAGSADPTEQIRAELIAEFEAKQAAAVEAAKSELMAEILAKYEAEKGKAEQPKVMATPDPDDDGIPEEQKPVYRCLDCGQEFDTTQKLGAHRRKHRDD